MDQTKKYRMREGQDEIGPIYCLEVQVGDHRFGPLYEGGVPVAYRNKELAEKHLKVLRLRTAADMAAVDLTLAIEADRASGEDLGGEQAAA